MLRLAVILGGGAAIVAVVIHVHKDISVAPPPSREVGGVQTSPAPKPPTESDYQKRGLRGNTSPAPRAPDNGTQAVAPKPVEPRFIGDAVWKRYHRLDCKYAKLIADDKKVPFATPEEALAQDYVPCRFCNPEMSSAPVAPAPAPEPGQAPKHAVRPKDPPKSPLDIKLVGDAEWKRYHRGDCRYAKLIADDKRVPVASAAEAYEKGFVPCRLCNPDLGGALAELPLPPLPPPVDPGPSTPEPRWTPPKPVAPVTLTDRQKMDMYKSLFALKEMLKGISTRERPYEVLSDRYRVPVSAVEGVETEGNGKRWPKR